MAMQPIPLDSLGKIYDKNKKALPQNGGLLCIFQNHLVRGKIWNLMMFTIHSQTGEMCLADERGQIFFFNFASNLYSSLRLASRPILSMELIHSRPSNLLVGYANGFTICIDTNSNEIKSTLYPKNSDPICFMKCSPTKALAVLLSTAGKLSLWDLSQLSTIRQMDIPEPIIDIHFLADSLIIVVFQTLGAIVYGVSDSMKVEKRCTTPSSERKPNNWVSSCVIYQNPHSSNPSHILLAGDNGLMYLFDLTDSNNTDLCSLVSIIELPPQARMTVAITSVSVSSASHLPFIYLIALLDSRQLIIIEGIFHDSDSDPWRWKVINGFLKDVGKIRPLSPQFYPTNVERFSHSPHELSTLAYSLSSLSAGDETTHYVLILDGLLYVFDWKSISAKMGDSTRHEALLSRLPRGSHANTVSTSVLSGRSTSDVGRSGPDSTFHLGRGNYDEKDESVQENTSVRDFQPGPSNSQQERKECFSKEKNSLYQLIQSSPASEHLTEPKLRIFLKKFGQYPSRYRPVVWRFLLQLPENESSFAALCSRQGPSQYDSFKVHNKVAERRVAQRLRNVCKLLTFWSPVFGEVDYLPQFVFPFSVVFGSDEMSCLEAVMTLLMWFGHSWQATYPNPPIHVTDCYDRLLEHHDYRLHRHLYSLDLSPGLLAWRILSTFFSEILPSDIWLSLMDRIFTNIKDVNFVYLVPIAIMRLVRISLLSATEKRHASGFLREPQYIGLDLLIKMILEMKKSTPSHLFSWTFNSIKDIKNLFLANPSTSELEKTHAHLSIVAQEGVALFPLPKGQYPAYDGYPAHLLDWQVQERNRVLSMKRDIEMRENTLFDLENQIKEMEQHSKLQKNQSTHTTHGNFVEMMEREKQYLYELSSLEERITKQRLLNMKKMEEMTQDQLVISEKIEEEAKQLLEKSELHLKERIEAALLSEKHRELGEVAEMMTRANLEKMYMKKWREEKLAGVTAAIRLQQENIDLKNRYIFQKWKQEDDQAKLESRLRVEEAKLLMQTQIESNIDVALEENALRLYREQEAKIMELERQRNLRLLQERGPKAAPPISSPIAQPINSQQPFDADATRSSTSSESVSSITSTVSLQGLISKQKERHEMPIRLDKAPKQEFPREEAKAVDLAIDLENSSLLSSRDSDELLHEAQRILDKTEAFSASDQRRKNLIKYVSQMSISSSKSGDSLSVHGIENSNPQIEINFQNTTPVRNVLDRQWKIDYDDNQFDKEEEVPPPPPSHLVSSIPSKTTRALEQLTQVALRYGSFLVDDDASRDTERTQYEVKQYREILGYVHRTDSLKSLSTHSSHQSLSSRSLHS